ncbi:response regulator [Siccirubricoccus sp. G192]|uniref:response regulator n=1 Tax=Siccirubricoccus sp. G192 TaxID=2849651 RepID=UPI002811E773|nr:response regulator [Siccirubricoccus sp. G192]
MGSPGERHGNGAGRRGRIAIADLLEMVLTDEGYHVLTAANGRQGLERLAEGPRPDLVISDYMMPVLDGVGLLRAMRESEAQHDIPCIVMSSMPEASVRERIDGYEAFVRKPFDLDAMVQLVATILETPRPKP